MTNDHDAPFTESALAREAQIERTRLFFEGAASSPNTTVIPGGYLRPLFQTEVTALSSYNQCQDWSKVRLWVAQAGSACDQSTWLEHHVTFNTFKGIVVIGVSQDEPSSTSASATTTTTTTTPAPGIHHNTLIANCIFEHQCRVYRNSILTDTHVGINAVVINNGQVVTTAAAASSSDNNDNTHAASLKLSVGPESGGGRNLFVQAESTMIDVCHELGMSRHQKLLSTAATACSPWNIIGDDCVVRDTPTISNICMADSSKILAATLVEHAILLPTSEISHGASAKHVLLQWNASISHQSSVTHTLLMECASAGPLSTVADSVLGPDVHVSAGEVHASVLGPNTNAHHQSLLIGVLWPLGRGNVGYGANVGSNHTGRLPDQECLSGEGTFWGLSTVIKFPVYMGPYALVAAGTTLAPQRMELPFSLLVENDLIPAWLLSHSPYTLARSETKFATRRKALRHDFYTGWKILRPATINSVLSARVALQNPVSQAEDDVYKTERAIAGIGNMQVTEKGRRAGIVAYTACLRRYALSGLLEYYQTQGGDLLEHELGSVKRLEVNDFSSTTTTTRRPQWPILPWEEEDLWIHQKKVLVQEFPRHAGTPFFHWIADLLQELVQLEHDYARRVYSSKHRDDDRGAKTIPAYADSHVDAIDDTVVTEAQARAQEVERAVETVLGNVSGTTRSRL